MTLQIKAIGIYSIHGEFRKVLFQLGTLNIITGAAKTGKSALLDIVDYCWGRDECTVPRGDFRKTIDWFAVLFDRDGEDVFVARRNPVGSDKASDEVYFMRGIDMPQEASSFVKNVTASALRNHLSTLLGIAENLYVPEAGSSRRPQETTSAQAILLCLQFQYEIANPRQLFHRQNEEYVPTAIKDALPYFLGAMADDHVIRRKRYEDARLRLRRLERELEDTRALANERSGIVRELFLEAQRKGLVPIGSPPESPLELRSALERAVTSSNLYSPAGDDPALELADLEERRRQVRDQLQDLREEISDLRRIRREASEFVSEVGEQRARLASLELLHERHAVGDQEVCPVCASVLDTPVPAVSQLRLALGNLSDQLRSVERDNPRVERRLAELEENQSQLEETLRSIQREIAQRIQENERLRVEQAQFTEIARLRGRIEYYLESVEAIGSDEGLRLAVARTRAEVAELAKTVDNDAVEERLTTALGIVGRDLTKYASALQLEHGENALRLDRRNLTIVADAIEGPLPLTQIGSGENWVGYHIAAHLALHRLLRTRRRPVPGFLMLDQPSQAHYPPEQDVGQISGVEGEDQQAVSRLYKTLLEFTRELDGRFQIIVTDHVELLTPWFRAAIAERWRDGIKLVPLHWMNEQ